MDESEAREAALREFAGLLHIPLGNAALFDQALTHASTGGETPDEIPDYESLEFLGDAVLGLAAAHRLFETRPNLTPGEYTRLRAALVNRDAVARVGEAEGIAPYIRLGKGEESSGGRNRRALISDCMEALIGALYLDSGWETARDFVVRVFESEFEKLGDPEFAADYRSRLQEWCQARQLPLPDFRVAREEGPDHRKEFAIEVVVGGDIAGRGSGVSKKSAQQAAAKEALEKLELADRASA